MSSAALIFFFFFTVCSPTRALFHPTDPLFYTNKTATNEQKIILCCILSLRFSSSSTHLKKQKNCITTRESHAHASTKQKRNVLFGFFFLLVSCVLQHVRLFSTGDFVGRRTFSSRITLLKHKIESPRVLLAVTNDYYYYYYYFDEFLLAFFSTIYFLFLIWQLYRESFPVHEWRNWVNKTKQNSNARPYVFFSCLLVLFNYFLCFLRVFKSVFIRKSRH